MKHDAGARLHPAVCEATGPIDKQAWRCQPSQPTTHGAQIINFFLEPHACRHQNVQDSGSPTDHTATTVTDALNVRLETRDPISDLPIISKLTTADEAIGVAREYAACGLSRTPAQYPSRRCIPAL